ncbi:hypothetical protein RHOSPDRAFT_25949 [Rhodotorula sp. JG-1b]|nr:hypothetical protein RHOSPDRAFT_25949 [Rhodotorula sp. JG-1b]
MALVASIGRLLTSRRGLIALAIALATIYTLTLYDATALTGPARAASPASSSKGSVAAKVRENWSWGTGGGIMGDMGGDAGDNGPPPVEAEAIPRKNYRADEDPILAIPGAVDPEEQAARLANHHARPFGKTPQDALKPADRAAVEEAKAKAGVYSPQEMARLEAELAEAQAPVPRKKVAAQGGGGKKQAVDKKKGAKQGEITTDTTTAESAQETGGGGGTVDEEAGSATSTPGEDGLEDTPSVATKKGAADAAPMAALVLPPTKGKDAPPMPKDVQQAIADKADAAANSETTEAASHAAAKAASFKSDHKKEVPPPPSEKIRQPEPAKGEKVLVAEPDAEEAVEEDLAAPAGGKPKIGTGGRVVKPLPGGDSAQKPAKPQRVGGGEKAGKVVKQEAGKRVGTGARPGAKGMGMPRMRLVKRL